MEVDSDGNPVGPGQEGGSVRDDLSSQGGDEHDDDPTAPLPCLKGACSSGGGLLTAGALEKVKASRLALQSATFGENGQPGVHVEVKPLFARNTPSVASGRTGRTVRTVTTVSSRQRVNPAVDFSDLPSSVASALTQLKSETRGPTRTAPKLRMRKVMSKINTIKKYSRKGKGKKRTYGKKSKRA